jgi:hypothetical protein
LGPIFTATLALGITTTQVAGWRTCFLRLQTELRAQNDFDKPAAKQIVAGFLLSDML